MNLLIPMLFVINSTPKKMKTNFFKKILFYFLLTTNFLKFGSLIFSQNIIKLILVKKVSNGKVWSKTWKRFIDILLDVNINIKLFVIQCESCTVSVTVRQIQKDDDKLENIHSNIVIKTTTVERNTCTNATRAYIEGKLPDIFLALYVCTKGKLYQHIHSVVRCY